MSKNNLKETEKFVNSMLTQMFFLIQTDMSRDILSKTNANRSRNEAERRLKQLISDSVKVRKRSKY